MGQVRLADAAISGLSALQMGADHGAGGSEHREWRGVHGVWSGRHSSAGLGLLHSLWAVDRLRCELLSDRAAIKERELIKTHGMNQNNTPNNIRSM